MLHRKRDDISSHQFVFGVIVLLRVSTVMQKREKKQKQTVAKGRENVNGTGTKVADQRQINVSQQLSRVI